jgi:hypothetical protein
MRVILLADGVQLRRGRRITLNLAALAMTRPRLLTGIPSGPGETPIACG